MNSKDIRNSFIDYFKSKDHNYVRSAPVVPIDDPTLLFTNAGMNQFKSIFLNQSKPTYLRAVNSQKCIRVSGKHNDLEEVGLDTFHHTFFEMLGNWSFGEYYKKEAIEWAWELFTQQWKLDKNRLWATVYKDDDEAFELWKNVTDIDPDRLIRCGKKDNFWEMGETGPCGPCSEIHYYVGDSPDKQMASGVNSSDEYWELWNLVFIQNNRLDDGTLVDLPEKHVDTGAGLERIATILQGERSNYDTDLFLPIINALQLLAGSSYQNDPIPHRVIADHIRMLCFSIADGALPSNDGRGYVLRRILRRAARFGRSIGLVDPFLYELVPVVGKIMGDVFPEILEKKTHIKNVLLSEEESFNNTLDRGLNHFEKIIGSIDGSNISGKNAFKLYDTYGFPLDLTQLIAREKNLSVDEKGFEDCMNQQKQKSKTAGKFKAQSEQLQWVELTEGEDSKFLGYNRTETFSNIIQYAEENNIIYLVLDQTPFYAESGGQVGDQGTITGENISLKVLDVRKENDSFIHICEGNIINANDKVHCKVDVLRRQSIKKNHTATHLMHKALKTVLGQHVNQAGSLVHPDYLRFDLTHFEKISKHQIQDIEKMVNDQIIMNTQLNVSMQNFDDAKKDGAEAIFGEKYGDEVRVVTVGDYSMELCGGTHVDRTGDIGLFKIIEESSLASGVRRIVALTGLKAVLNMQDNYSVLDGLQSLLNTPPSDMIQRVDSLLKEKKSLKKKIKNRLSTNKDLNIFNDIETINNHQLIIKKVSASDMNELKSLGDIVFNKLSNGVAVFFAEGDEKPIAVAVVTKNLTKKGINAGLIAKDVGAFMGGGGGGKPHLASAGGKHKASIIDAMDQTRTLILNILNGL